MTSTLKDERVTETEERLVLEASVLGEAPSSVLIAPWGEVRSSNGRFVVDDEAAERVIEAFQAHGTDLPIDYEHQSLGGVYAAPSGLAPAAGWIRGLRAARPGENGEAGLFAEVAWTQAGREKLAAKEYRYLSPVVIVRKRDRKVVALHSAALTNKPAIAGMRPIVNRMPAGTDTSGQANPAAPGGAGGDGPARAAAALRDRLELPAECDVEAVLVAAHERLEELTDDAARRAAEERVAEAMRAGKLAPAQRAWAASLAMRDPASFTAWAESAPVVVMLGRTEAPGGAGVRGDQAAVIQAARAEFRAEPGLQLLTSEGAYVREALRQAGLEGADGQDAARMDGDRGRGRAARMNPRRQRRS